MFTSHGAFHNAPGTLKRICNSLFERSPRNNDERFATQKISHFTIYLSCGAYENKDFLEKVFSKRSVETER